MRAARTLMLMTLALAPALPTVVVTHSAWAARAQDGALLKKEQAARKKCAAEFLKLAKWCALQKEFDTARAELRRGLRFRPDYTKLTR